MLHYLFKHMTMPLYSRSNFRQHRITPELDFTITDPKNEACTTLIRRFLLLHQEKSASFVCFHRVVIQHMTCQLALHLLPF